MKRAVVPLVDVCNRLVRADVALIPDDARVYFRDVYDHVIRINEMIDTLRELLTTALEANLSLISVSQNEAMKRLAAWAAIIAVPTMIAGSLRHELQVHARARVVTAGYPVTMIVMVGACGFPLLPPSSAPAGSDRGTPEVLLDDRGQAVDRAERVDVGLPVDGDVILALAGPSQRKDLDRDVGTRSRAAAGAALAQPHALTQPALAHELREVLRIASAFRRTARPPRVIGSSTTPRSRGQTVITILRGVMRAPAPRPAARPRRRALPPGDAIVP